MSFSKQAKREMLDAPLSSECCALSFLCSLIHSSGQIELNKSGEADLSIITDMGELFEYINKILLTLYGENANLEISDDYKINQITYFKITFDRALALRVLLDTGCVSVVNGTLQENTQVDDHIVEDICCKKAFIKGAFVGCATSSIRISERPNQKTSSGYHIEFASKKQEYLRFISHLLAEFEVLAKTVERKKLFVLYVKDSGQVSDVLAICEANQAVLALVDEMAKRELRNKVNRQTNCLSANISRTVVASAKQLADIEYIIDKAGLENLPPELQDVALLRLANPEESLEDLLKIGNLPFTKSALNHRFKKISKIAQRIKG